MRGLLSVFDIHSRMSRAGLYRVVAGYFAYGGLLLFVIPKPPELHVFLLALAPAVVVVVFAMIRRLHDRDRSAWWLGLAYGAPALAFLLIANFLVPELERLGDGLVTTAAGALLLVAVAPSFWIFYGVFFRRGTPGPNRFGPDPLEAK